jgi:ribosomal protein S16
MNIKIQQRKKNPFINQIVVYKKIKNRYTKVENIGTYNKRERYLLLDKKKLNKWLLRGARLQRKTICLLLNQVI